MRKLTAAVLAAWLMAFGGCTDSAKDAARYVARIEPMLTAIPGVASAEVRYGASGFGEVTLGITVRADNSDRAALLRIMDASLRAVASVFDSKTKGAVHPQVVGADGTTTVWATDLGLTSTQPSFAELALRYR